jgi:dephospho-CoA kinase
MLRVGLTGGIGSGKSTVAQLFAARGVPVIDTDEIARDVVRPGEPAYTEVIQQFGQAVLEKNGALDRAKMRERVFNDPAERKRLEAILHPRIRAETVKRLAGIDAPYAVVVVPLLIETGFGKLIDRILVVDCEESLQLHRVMARNNMNEAEIRRILAAQVSRQERRARAHDIIDNNADPARLDEQVAKLHTQYLAFSKH